LRSVIRDLRALRASLAELEVGTDGEEVVLSPFAAAGLGDLVRRGADALRFELSFLTPRFFPEEEDAAPLSALLGFDMASLDDLFRGLAGRRLLLLLLVVEEEAEEEVGTSGTDSFFLTSGRALAEDEAELLRGLEACLLLLEVVLGLLMEEAVVEEEVGAAGEGEVEGTEAAGSADMVVS
jgi:hypothetical protein